MRETTGLNQMPKPAQKPLTIKQQRFVNCYDGNATQAAKDAGYKGSNNTLRKVGFENLTKPNVKQAIRDREKKRNRKLIADREARQEFWTDIMNDENADMKDRLRASELLGRSEADFTDKQISTNPETQNIMSLVADMVNKARQLPAPERTEAGIRKMVKVRPEPSKIVGLE